MSEVKDPAIKLFGKTIALPEISQGATSTSHNNNNNNIASSPSLDGGRVDEDDSALDQDRPPCASSCHGGSDIIITRRRDGEQGGETDKDTVERKATELNQETEHKQENDDPPATEGESSNPHAASGRSENSENSSSEKENTISEATKTGEQNETNNSQEKTLKKPDKILPCPRCNSMDTKFCYYNNYNVNQPRHFCKNCQRYWTAGGTMRNVPVGAGRRKNKNSATHYRHTTVPEALQNVRIDVPNGVHPSLKANGTVLTFGSDISLHESMASVLNLVDKTLKNGTRNGCHNLEPLAIPVSYEGGKNGQDHSSRSAVAETNSKDETYKNGSQEAVMQNYHGFPPQLPCFPGAPWPYPWNSAQWSSPVPPPGFCPPGFAMPIFPAATYWGCAVPGPWNIPWLAQPSSPQQSSMSSTPNSPTLGKHSRDENMLKPSDSGEDEPMKDNNGERCLWIPKTLRIDDPEEAAKSSIWTTLGIKNDKPDLIGGRTLFKAFELEGNKKNHTAETSPVLQANPAALSRSVKFHESS